MDTTTKTNAHTIICDRIGLGTNEATIAPNTVARWTHETWVILLHGHVIAFVRKNGDVVIGEGVIGWPTKTTTARLNDILAPTGWHARRKGGRVVVDHPEAVGGPWNVEAGTILCNDAICVGLGDDA